MIKKTPIIFAYLLASVVLMVVFYSNTDLYFTGFVSIGQQSDYTYTAIWDFSDLGDYNYDDSLIEIDDEGAGLKLTTIMYEWQEEIIADNNAETALYDSNDRTDRIDAVDNKKLQVDKGKILDVSFERQVDNGDIISMHLDSSDPSDIYLCDLSSECDSPGYGLVSFDGNEGWHNITVSGLSSPVDGFNIDPVHVKFDYITAKDISYITHTEENITYPAFAELETEDYIVEGLESFDAFSYEHELNGAIIEYYYSTDSGENWNMIEDANLGSADTLNNKIKFKAVLYSDADSTPVLKEMRLEYIISCVEEWAEQYGECLADDTKLRYYADLNSCGTAENIPEDNGSYAECDYCDPSWDVINENCQITDLLAVKYYYTNNCCEETGLGSDCIIPENTTSQCDYCAPEWTSFQTDCRETDSLTEYYSDANNCYLLTGLESDNNPPANKSYDCDYCAPEWNCISYGSCSQDNTKTCAELNDINNCYSITGLESDLAYPDYDEYTVSCVYDDVSPSLMSISLNPSNAVRGDVVNITANVTDDKSQINSVVVSLKNKDNIVRETIILNEESSLFSASYNTSSLDEGIYFIDLAAADSYNNSIYYKDKGLLVVSPYVEGAYSDNYLINENERTIINNTGSKTIIEVTSFKTINDSIYFIEYSESPVNVTAEKNSAGTYIEIIEQNISKNLNFAVIKVYYDEAEISSLNLDEDSLKLYYFNETSLEWQELESFVNTDENYVYVNITHLSLFGIYGDEIQISTADSGSSSGGGGGGGSATGGSEFIISNSREKTESETEKKIITKPKQETKKTDIKEECYYSVSFYKDGEISFVEDSTYGLSLENTGNCDIEQINISLSSNLMQIARIPNPLIRNLEKGGIAEFDIIKKQAKPLNALIQGFAVKLIEPGVNELTGEINTIAFKDKEVIVNNSIPVLIKTKSFTQPTEINKGLFGLAALFTLFLFIVGFKLKTFKYNQYKKI